jgi:hypothetical protein
MRPEGTADLEEAELAALVTREGLIGTAAVYAVSRPAGRREVRHLRQKASVRTLVRVESVG